MKNAWFNRFGNRSSQKKGTRVDARWVVVFLAVCPFFVLMATQGYGAKSVQSSSGGPSFVAQVFTPCYGSADLYPSTNNRYLGSAPDFSAATLSLVTIDGVSTWELIVLGPPGSACRPSKRFRLFTPSTNPEGDYCLVAAGGCDAGQAAVFIP